MLIKLILKIFQDTIIIKNSQKISKKAQEIDSRNAIIGSGDKCYVMKPINWAPQCWPFSILSFLLTIGLFLIEHFMSPVKNNNEKLGFIIAVSITLFISFFLGIMGLYGIVHEIRVEGNEILYRTMFGRCKKYSFSEITKAVSNHEDKVRIYNGNKRLFTLTSGMDSTFFQVKLMKLGVPIEDIKGMTTDFHTVQPYGIFKWGAAVTLAFFSVIMVNLVEEDGVIVIACALFNAFLLFSVFKFFIEKTEVQGDTITQRAFLKKKQVIKISQISCLREEFKGSVPFVAIYSGKEKIMRIRRFSDGIVLFEAKMRKEEIRWHRN